MTTLATSLRLLDADVLIDIQCLYAPAMTWYAALGEALTGCLADRN